MNKVSVITITDVIATRPFVKCWHAVFNRKRTISYFDSVLEQNSYT